MSEEHRVPTSAGAQTRDAGRSFAPRVIGFTPRHELACSRGHHIREDSFQFDDGVVICKHREPLRGGKGGGPECGKLLYILADWQPRGLVRVAPTNPLELPPDALLLVIEVTYREVREIQRQRLDVPGVLRFLGVRFPFTGLTTA
jgi:hypothetical protein